MPKEQNDHSPNRERASTFLKRIPLLKEQKRLNHAGEGVCGPTGHSPLKGVFFQPRDVESSKEQKVGCSKGLNEEWSAFRSGKREMYSWSGGEKEKGPLTGWRLAGETNNKV